MLPEPSRRLAPGARWLWRAQGLMASVAALIGAGVLQSSAPGGVAWMLVPIFVLAIGVGVVRSSSRRPSAAHLRHGTLRITRTLVPMLRVQHVDTTQGPIDQALGLATVVVHTAAGATTIPALEEAHAGRLRDHIATLARTADEL